MTVNDRSCRCDWEECGRRSRSPWLHPSAGERSGGRRHGQPAGLRSSTTTLPTASLQRSERSRHSLLGRLAAAECGERSSQQPVDASTGRDGTQVHKGDETRVARTELIDAVPERRRVGEGRDHKGGDERVDVVDIHARVPECGTEMCGVCADHGDVGPACLSDASAGGRRACSG